MAKLIHCEIRDDGVNKDTGTAFSTDGLGTGRLITLKKSTTKNKPLDPDFATIDWHAGSGEGSCLKFSKIEKEFLKIHDTGTSPISDYNLFNESSQEENAYSQKRITSLNSDGIIFNSSELGYIFKGEADDKCVKINNDGNISCSTINGVPINNDGNGCYFNGVPLWKADSFSYISGFGVNSDGEATGLQRINFDYYSITGYYPSIYATESHQLVVDADYGFSIEGNINTTGTINGVTIDSTGNISGGTINGATINSNKFNGVTLSEGKINGVQITATTFNGATINSSSFNGTTIKNGDITTSGTITANLFNATSDIRLKENIKEYTPGESILDLPVKEFDYKDTKQHEIGCIAQELQELFPELVSEGEDGYLSVKETKLVYLLLLEMKKMKKEIEYLKENKYGNI